MENSINMFLEAKTAIKNSPKLWDIIKQISFNLYKSGEATTTEEINNKWNDVLLVMLYQNNEHFRQSVNDDVWAALQTQN